MTTHQTDKAAILAKLESMAKGNGVNKPGLLSPDDKTSESKCHQLFKILSRVNGSVLPFHAEIILPR